MKSGLAIIVLSLLTGCGSDRDVSIPSPATQPPSSVTATTTTTAGPAMPDVVGMRLADARQLLSAQGYPKVEQVDASGQDRPILEPVNWVVQAQDPAAGSPVPHGTAVTLHVTKPSDSTGQTETADGIVPNVVCMDLQRAQDTLQAAGFYILGSEDATGQGRQQLVDRNWVVVSQSVTAGARPDPATRITLGAVKFGEPTGDSRCRS